MIEMIPAPSHRQGNFCALDAARRGAWIGARAVQVLGDTEGLPTRVELDAAIAAGVL